MQTMGEFASLTERLALMPDPALQQFAQMHKEDPFTLALAVSESNRRRKMRTAQQGVAGMQQQPAVADQEIAQMAAPVMPENVGIGALPAPSMAGMPAGGIAGEEEMEPQTMAGGGMVAFADGGDVERYSGEFGSFITSGEPLALDELRRQELLRQRKAAEDAARLQFLNTAAPEVAQRLRAEQTVSSAYPDEVARRMRSGVAAAAPAATPRPSAPGAGSAARAPAAGATAGAAPAGGLSDLASLFNKTLAEQKYRDPAEERLKALETTEREAAQADKAALERDQARFADAFKGREARLGKREEEIGKFKDTNTGLSLLNAGLAIMSTPGGLATAIGKGARVGTEQFAAGLDKIRSAQERLDEARDRMEELRLNRDEMSAKDIRAAESKIRQVSIDAEKRGIDGLRQAGQINRETAKTIFDKTVQVGITREEIAGRAQTASIAANAQQNFMKALGEAKPDSPLRRGFEIAKQEGAVPTLYANYQKLASDETPTMGGQYATKGEAFRARYPGFEDFMSQYPGALGGGQTGFVQPPAGGAPVLKKPGT